MLIIDECQKLVLDTMFTLPEVFTRNELIETANDQHPMLFETYGVLFMYAACMSLLIKLERAGVIMRPIEMAEGYYLRLCDETLLVEIE